MEIAGLWVGSVIASLWVGSFIKPYLGEKAKNLATHEDLDKLVAQMQATTEATKRIEARISDEVWDRQKQWELKRDVLFDALKRMAEVDDALLLLNTAYVNRGLNETETRAEHREAVSQRWYRTMSHLDETKLLIATLCEEETANGFGTLVSTYYEIGQEVMGGKKTAYWDSQVKQVGIIGVVRSDIRRELGVKESPTSQSTGSSAVPSPDSRIPE